MSELDLSRGQHRVMELVAIGLSNAEIGERLHLSPLTVKNHVQAILRKMGTVNRTEAAIKYILHRCKIERPDWMPV